jgi:hypothetical protein
MLVAEEISSALPGYVSSLLQSNIHISSIFSINAETFRKSLYFYAHDNSKPLYRSRRRGGILDEGLMF